MASSTHCRRLLPLLMWLVLLSVGFAQRDVQISSILFNDGDAIFEAFELTNYGASTHDMSNWRLCSHDGNQVRIYSSGIGGMIDPGETKLLFARDFTLASPFTPAAYSLAIFDMNAGGFGGTANIVDHLQWSIDGVDNSSAGFRSSQAVTGGVWTSATDWIVTTQETSRITLKEASKGLVLHGPDDYETVVVLPPLPCDWDGDGICGLEDLDLLTTQGASLVEIEDWLNLASDFGQSAITYRIGDINLSGGIDSADLGLLLNNFGSADAVYSAGNVNGDNVVDSSDLGLVLNNFGFESASSAAVPEPGGLLLLAFACVGLLTRSRATRR